MSAYHGRIVDWRFDELADEYVFKVKDGRARTQWIREFTLPGGIVEEYKTSMPEVWTPYRCSPCAVAEFVRVGEEGEGPEDWLVCVVCKQALCEECADDHGADWKRCYFEQCGALVCPEHARERRITTPYKWHDTYFCCVPWMVVGADGYAAAQRLGWDVGLDAEDMALWERHGWLDEAGLAAGVPIPEV